MAIVRTFTLPHYDAFPIHVALFRDVTNASHLRTQLLDANAAYDYAFLDANMILSPTHLLSTTFLTLHALFSHRQKTRTPHSELVFRLSPNNNIGESYKKFGLSDTTSNLIAVKLPLKLANEGKDWVIDPAITNESVSQHLGSVVEGTSIEVGEKGEELGDACDVEKVRKVYKLNANSAAKKGKKETIANGDRGDENRERKEMEVAILGTIALKGS